MPPVSPVALIIAAKDAADTIGTAVASALRQEPVSEVVVVDDGSRDQTSAAARAADDGSGRLSIIRLEQNLGPSAARNRAIAASSAPVIGILDADDLLEPGRVASMMARAPGDWDLLADNIVFKPQGQEDGAGDLLIRGDLAEPMRLDAAAFVLGNLRDARRSRRELGFLKPLMRREFLLRQGLSYDETLRLGEDFVLYTRALLRGGVFWVVGAGGYVAIERAASLSGAHGGDDLAALAEATDGLVALAQGDLEAVRALSARLRETRLKRDYAQMLEAKQRGQYGLAARTLFRTPETAAYILTATARARAARFRR